MYQRAKVLLSGPLVGDRGSGRKRSKSETIPSRHSPPSPSEFRLQIVGKMPACNWRVTYFSSHALETFHIQTEKVVLSDPNPKV